MWRNPDSRPCRRGDVEPRVGGTSMRRLALTLTLSAALIAPAAIARGDETVGPGGGTPGTSSSFQLVGHDPLFARGMNAAPAFHEGFVYVGNRTDGSSRCGLGDPRRDTLGLDACPHPNPGVLVVDAT